MINACDSDKITFETFADYPVPADTNLWTSYSTDSTLFKIWSPTADKVLLHLYESGDGGEPFQSYEFDKDQNGLWIKRIKGDLNGTYYTYQIMTGGTLLQETPGIYARAVGVNGKRAMVLDLDSTDPEGWLTDNGPRLTKPNDAIIYELHIRDMTIHPHSGSGHSGKYLGLTESGTLGPDGVTTGIDHLVELGITHVHLLPSYDHYSIDESRLDSAQFNWGYDPQNYNVPEGSFSTDPFSAEVRIKEFKEMVKAFHDKGIGVILDVVYNHTGRTENSNFNLEVPGYYYRQWEDGRLSDASACGNETASERTMMRRFIVESVLYWAKEYHLDGFRFDLMGIHDISTMNEVTEALHQYNPNIIIYGEGWTAGDSPLPLEDRAVKANIVKMPGIAAFCDDIRDGLKGSVFDDNSTGFVSGASDMEESVKFGIVGAIQHPQVNYELVNYSKEAWTLQPWQSIAYVSCHDNHTLYDKLKVSRRDATEKEIIAMDKLANAVVMTSQSIAFLHAGAEMLRTKNEEHNSYNLPDSINRIDWNRKAEYPDVFNYYKNLIKLRSDHPAFRMSSAEDVRKNLEFKVIDDGLVSYQISNHAHNDIWQNILVVYNARTESVNYQLEGSWQLAVSGDMFDPDGNKSIMNSIKIAPISMAVLFQK